MMPWGSYCNNKISSWHITTNNFKYIINCICHYFYVHYFMYRRSYEKKKKKKKNIQVLGMMNSLHLLGSHVLMLL